LTFRKGKKYMKEQLLHNSLIKDEMQTTKLVSCMKKKIKKKDGESLNYFIFVQEANN
jgi:hypothetical protein